MDGLVACDVTSVDNECLGHFHNLAVVMSNLMEVKKKEEIYLKIFKFTD
jgi:hypothetical protein